jgi:hypothetical protein
VLPGTATEGLALVILESPTLRSSMLFLLRATIPQRPHLRA